MVVLPMSAGVRTDPFAYTADDTEMFEGEFQAPHPPLHSVSVQAGSTSTRSCAFTRAVMRGIDVARRGPSTPAFHRGDASVVPKPKMSFVVLLCILFDSIIR
jgi:hypothetical protein